MSHNYNSYDNDKEEKEKINLDLITSSISVCIEHGKSAMNDKVSEAARNYYLSIVNNNNLSINQQKHKIYKDLVIGTKANLLNKNDKKIKNIIMDNNNNNKLNISYRIGLNNDIISKVNGEIICVGQYKENDIYIESPHISRIHCFIFKINNKLIILDGWSKYGTNTINIACNNDNDNNNNNNNDDNKNEIDIIEIKEYISSYPKQRNILQFNINDTIHLKLGGHSYGIDIIINPKLCIICMEKARIIRLNCGHQVLCKQCYNKINQNIYSSKCPICRNDIIINNKISAGVHTYNSQ